MLRDLTLVKGERAVLLSAGYRPFFLLGAAWAAIAVPVWLAAYIHGLAPGAMPAITWHAHEMIYGYALAVVAGFMLAAVPDWTHRLPSRGLPLAALAALWLAGRVTLLVSAPLGALVDVAFPLVLAAALARELVAGRHWRGLPMLAAVALLAAGDVLVQLQVVERAGTAALGERLGIATLAGLIALVGGRLVPSFTRNWLARARPQVAAPAQGSPLDVVCLALTLAGLAAWVAFPYSGASAVMQILGGSAAALRLSRWRTAAVAREPFLLVLHAGYGWLAFGIFFLGANGLAGWLPPGAGVHAITVGAVGTMTLAVMTRTTLRYAGRPPRAGPGTLAIYALITLAALLRIGAPLAGAHAAPVTSLAGIAWTAAFGLFVLLYGPLLVRPRLRSAD